MSKEKATEVWNLLDKFANYGFNKSHASAYGVISYQTAFLKANFTSEFLIASMNLEIDNSDKIQIFIQDAMDMNIKIIPPDINQSCGEFALDSNKNIIFAIGAIKNVTIKIGEIIRLERKKKQKRRRKEGINFVRKKTKKEKQKKASEKKNKNKNTRMPPQASNLTRSWARP